MADNQPRNHVTLPSSETNPSYMSNLDMEEGQIDSKENKANIIDYAKRAQWLRAAVLGANDGLLSTASLMMGVGAVKKDSKTMIIAGVAGLIGGACSMAIGELVSVYSQYDIELAQMEREGDTSDKDKLPNPFQASIASAIAFATGAMVPLLGAAFVKDYKTRLGVVVAVVSVALVVFGWLGAVLGKAPLVRSSLRVLIGGWFAMALTFGLTKLFGSAGV
ncbi:hypothetical protein TanjilG_09788 [Lupinus angustifolius]|uniref:Vacuolar iron transporter n=1 Tax=Lupinus angustifolius TaxID=3871 RepID=A0A4P1QWC7_LUPAN|nr:PREDICTED: vacuolar iron transporter homolog 4-like [Lupinus angustifolius]OIV96361.1 hypothetical protein TanjilG_09788 [Lupinus angustifolius]